MMRELTPNGGIPRGTLFAMAVIGGLTVANLYYNQPLLEAMRQSLGATELQANLITFITQLGYAAGLVLVVPLADKVSRRKIITVNMSVAVACCMVIALTCADVHTRGESFLQAREQVTQHGHSAHGPVEWCARRKSTERICRRMGWMACHVCHCRSHHGGMPYLHAAHTACHAEQF